jgi:hypothetical protein
MSVLSLRSIIKIYLLVFFAIGQLKNIKNYIVLYSLRMRTQWFAKWFQSMYVEQSW